ncbi:MAG: hypothetical protein LC131_08610 [Anaerolineae bacterium]|nr:hypothetical protein [Anaerolineae bacterium]
MSRRRDILPAAVLVLLLATFLRFHLLGAQSFWNDEGNSARLSERSIALIIEGTASDVHPPLYYLLLHGWRELAGATEFGLRAFSAYAGVLVVAMTAALARQALRTPVGSRIEQKAGLGGYRSVPVIIMAAVLAAVNPALVYYSQETRMYALLALLAVAATWALLNGLQADNHTGRPWGWTVAYTGLVAAGLYTHYFFPAVIVAHGLIAALYWGWTRGMDGRKAQRWLTVWIGMVAVAVALYSPWLPIFARQIGGREGAGEKASVFLASAGRWLVAGGTMPVGEANWALWAAVALALVGTIIGRRRAVVALMMLAIPVGAATALGATDPAFFKFLLVSAPFLAVLMGLAWAENVTISRKPWVASLCRGWPVIPGVLTVAVLAGSFLSLGHMYYDPAFARADYRQMAARIEADKHPNAAIVLVAPNQWEAFTYYHREGAPVYPLPRGRPDPEILSAELEQIVASHDRIYALFWGETQRDPEHVVERWLDAHAFKAAEEWVGDVRFVVYAVARESDLSERMQPEGARFTGLDGEAIVLESFAVGSTPVHPGDVVEVRLIWQAEATPAQPYKVFIHVLDGTGAVVAQRDAEPVGGSRPTTSWGAGELIEDNHGVLLPLDLPAGSYELRLGLYDAFDPQVRLMVEGADSLSLGKLIVER